MRISDWSSDVCSSDLPVVVVASARPPDRVSSVGIDDFEAARAMTRHLLAMGHDRIGFIVGNPNQHASARRLEGYRAALEEIGRAHVCTPVTNAHLVCRLLLEKKNKITTPQSKSTIQNT